MPPGRYLASYQLWVTASSSDGPNCRFRYPDSSTVGFAYPTAKGSTYSTLAGTAILDTRGLSSPVVLDCSQLSDSQVYDGSTPSTVSLVELDRVRLRSVRTR